MTEGESDDSAFVQDREVECYCGKTHPPVEDTQAWHEFEPGCRHCHHRKAIVLFRAVEDPWPWWDDEL